MKYLKMFEELNELTDKGEEYIKDKESFFDAKSYWVFADNYLKIHKILHGANKGKIQFRIFNKKAAIGQEFTDKYSMMFGSTLILNTEYVNLPKIREITIGPVLFRKVPTNTMEAILNLFIEEIGYDDSMLGYSTRRGIAINLKTVFEDKIRNIALKAKNLGDIFDGLKQVKDEIFEYQKEHYDNWKLQKDSEKYNI